MKDFYKRLEIAPQSDTARIETALRACSDPELRIDASHVLLNPERRRVYDRNRTALLRVSRLRTRLMLNDTLHWDARDYGDFIESSTKTTAAASADELRYKQENWFFANNALRFSLIFIGVTLVFIISYFLFYAK